MLFQRSHALDVKELSSAEKLAKLAFNQSMSLMEGALDELVKKGDLVAKQGSVMVFREVGLDDRIRIGYSLELETKDAQKIRDLEQEISNLKYALHAVQSWKTDK